MGRSSGTARWTVHSCQQVLLSSYSIISILARSCRIISGLLGQTVLRVVAVCFVCFSFPLPSVSAFLAIAYAVPTQSLPVCLPGGLLSSPVSLDRSILTLISFLVCSSPLSMTIFRHPLRNLSRHLLRNMPQQLFTFSCMPGPCKY